MKPQVIMLTKHYEGYYGYYYPKDILTKNGQITNQFKELAKKYSDLYFYDRAIFVQTDFKGLLTVEGDIAGAKPMIDLIEIRDHNEYLVVREGS